MTEDIKLDHRARKRIKEVKKKARPGESKLKMLDKSSKHNLPV
jgi:hypothetical protein